MAARNPPAQTKNGEGKGDDVNDEDPFDSLLSLEQTYYQNGYDEGYADGQRQARIEARLFGIQTAFNKFATAGKMRARAETWAARLGIGSVPGAECNTADDGSHSPSHGDIRSPRIGNGLHEQNPPKLKSNPRLEKHVETMLGLLDSAQLPLSNLDVSVAEVNVRLRRAQAKEKVIEKMIGEEIETGEPLETEITSQQRQHSSPKPGGDAVSFEDFGRTSTKHLG